MRTRVRCPTCLTSTRPGLLWLGGNDWAECPDCAETGEIEVIAERFSPRERTVSLAGIGAFTLRDYHPAVAHLQDALCRSTA